MITYKIYPIPHEVRGLEYLNLLHKHIEALSGEGSVFQITKFSWKSLLFSRFSDTERHIIHIHWETNVYGSRFVLVSAFRITTRFFFLWILKLRGVKIVWTMHNVYAHDYPHPRVDALGKEIMWKLANTVIIQEKQFAQIEMKKRPRAHIEVIPQGNYVGVYGPLWKGDRKQIRESFGFTEQDVVLLSLGSVRPYKAIPDLIEVIKKASEENKHIKLLITGKISEEYKKIIIDAVAGNPAIVLKLGFVPDEKIPELLTVADYSVFYYKDSSLSSAAMILSLSYGTPVITRNIPASSMITEGINGYVFKTSLQLKNILMKLDSTLRQDRYTIISTIEQQTWNVVALDLSKIYSNWN